MRPKMLSKNLCCLCTLIRVLEMIESAEIRCYSGSLENYEAAPLDTAESLLNSLFYNASMPNVFYTFGFKGKPNGPATTEVLNTLFSLNNKNVFLFDWEKEASSVEILGDFGRKLSYAFCAAPNAVIYGKRLGVALSRMSDYGLDLGRTHLIAHSLGAHLFGYAGRQLISIGKTIDRITGLDPALALFDQPRLLTPLSMDCASFVDVIHTSPGGYGINSSNGHLDIYVNYAFFISPEDSHIQPGCPGGRFDMFTDEDLCSHNRVWMLLDEAWTSYHTLQASKAANYSVWRSIGTSTEKVYIGDDIDRDARGNFFMTTNSQPPFGKGLAGLEP